MLYALQAIHRLHGHHLVKIGFTSGSMFNKQQHVLSRYGVHTKPIWSAPGCRMCEAALHRVLIDQRFIGYMGRDLIRVREWYNPSLTVFQVLEEYHKMEQGGHSYDRV